MEVTVEHLGAVQFAINARQHSVLSDQPAENGGYDEGMTPPELFLSSLGSCAGFYARLENFRIEVDVPAALNEEHHQGVEDAVRHCLIHNTLLHPPTIALKVQPAVSGQSPPVGPAGIPRCSDSDVPAGTIRFRNE